MKNNDLKKRIDELKVVDLRQLIHLEGESDYTHYKGGICPLHEDHSASLLVYENYFRCYASSCDRHGNIFDWFAYKFGMEEVPKGKQFVDLVARIELELGKVHVEPEQPKKEKIKLNIKLEDHAELYHELLLKNPKRLTWFYQRGFTLAIVKSELYGWDGLRYTIPVWQGIPQKSELLSIRFRGSELWDKAKYSGVEDHTASVLYNRQALDAICGDVLIFFGMLDARLAFSLGFRAVSPTNGLAFQAEWLDGIEGKKIFIPDIKEEAKAYKHAGQFGPEGWVVRQPILNGERVKDFTVYIQKGGTAKRFEKWIKRSVPEFIKNEET